MERSLPGPAHLVEFGETEQIFNDPKDEATKR